MVTDDFESNGQIQGNNKYVFTGTVDTKIPGIQEME